MFPEIVRGHDLCVRNFYSRSFFWFGLLLIGWADDSVVGWLLELLKTSELLDFVSIFTASSCRLSVFSWFGGWDIDMRFPTCKKTKTQLLMFLETLRDLQLCVMGLYFLFTYVPLFQIKHKKNRSLRCFEISSKPSWSLLGLVGFFLPQILEC